jgi:hypothetical protein
MRTEPHVHAQPMIRGRLHAPGVQRLRGSSTESQQLNLPYVRLTFKRPIVRCDPLSCDRIVGYAEVKMEN